MIENQKLFRERKRKRQKKEKLEADVEMKPTNDFCGSEHDNWQPDIEFNKSEKKAGNIFVFSNFDINRNKRFDFSKEHK